MVVAAVAGAALFPASAAAADLTPAGPATLLSQWLGASTTEGRPPEVLVAAEITVAPGGRPGTIRVRGAYRDVNAVGDDVHLPAEPGTYRFPAPHIRWDYRGSQIGFDQVSGGHAVVLQDACNPAAGDWVDPCKIKRVNVFSPPSEAASQPLPGAQLAVKAIYEADIDQDFVGDQTEDRTDLRISAVATRATDGKLRITATVTNAGPRAADMPGISTPLKDVEIEGCLKPGTYWYSAVLNGCRLVKPIAAGETRTVALTAPGEDAVTTTVQVGAEGPDLAEADNTVSVTAPASTPLAVTTAKSQRLAKGLKVRVLGIRDGRARVTAAFTRRGKTVKLAKVVTLKAGQERTTTLKPAGAKLRSLRRLIDGRSLRASVTVRSLATKDVATARTTVKP